MPPNDPAGLLEIELVGEPETPAGAEQVAAVAHFSALQRHEMAELYQLAAALSH